MKINSLDIFSDNTQLFRLALKNVPSTDKYLLKAQSGLDADEITRRFTGFSVTSGTRYFDVRQVKRSVALRMQLNPNYRIGESYSDIRDHLYRAIALSRTGILDLYFRSGGAIVAKLSGFITKFEVPLSSEIPEVLITLRCVEPLLRGINPVILTPGDLGDSGPFIIGDNVSTAPHGMSFAVEFTEAWTAFTMQDKLSFAEWRFQVIPDGGFLTGDILHVVSEANKTDVYIDRSETIIPLMDKITPGGMFPLMFPTNNYIHILDFNRMNWVHFTYYHAFWGV